MSWNTIISLRNMKVNLTEKKEDVELTYEVMEKNYESKN